MSDGSPGATVVFSLNGEPYEVPPATSVAAVLERLGRHPRTVAVEHNGEILPRRRYADTALAAGDRLEVVHFVQGG